MAIALSSSLDLESARCYWHAVGLARCWRTNKGVKRVLIIRHRADAQSGP
jgi:hypothetical protein